MVYKSGTITESIHIKANGLMHGILLLWTVIQSQFKNEGNDLEDYYCFGQNVIAPADGSVVVAEDGIEDNKHRRG